MVTSLYSSQDCLRRNTGGCKPPWRGTAGCNRLGPGLTENGNNRSLMWSTEYIYHYNMSILGLHVHRPSAFTASPSFDLNRFSASTHTRAVLRFGNSSKEGSSAALNCSDASLGSNVGRWSIETIASGGLPSLRRDRYVSITLRLHKEAQCLLTRPLREPLASRRLC